MELFNPQGSDRIEDRQLFFGNSTNIINLNNVKYDWATQLYRQMSENFWVPQKIDLTKDAKEYQELTDEERRAFIGILSYLIFLDSIQVSNLPNLMMPISAPEVKICLAMQLQQESIHSSSYQYLIESIIPTEDRQYIYDYWRQDGLLKARCEYIASIFQTYENNKTKENLYLALFADYLLEGIYFYSGFQFFFNLASRNIMQGTADMITYIMKDELTHVRLYQKILNELPLTDLENKLDIMAFNASEQEISWCNHIIGDSILGLSQSTLQDYIKWLTDSRMRALNLNDIYGTVLKNPLKHLENMTDIESEAKVKGNFFESTVTSYSLASAVDGWDF